MHQRAMVCFATPLSSLALSLTPAPINAGFVYPRAASHQRATVCFATPLSLLALSLTPAPINAG
eukprot:CAMPEP_0172300446 /NCGR_PEP_ID=MMETSP1058-20130122/2542_1 /TAXON_ID=83371 /ORGANISM="Detonula confervacea, Strain CCMP 353" /LENGTH=63 /DNA_ID=CAMNT_0013010223 /DNA_START=17 /DNA_END=205 /DNA_ORIENTATION=-